MAKFRVMIVDSDVRVRRCISDLIGSQLIDFEVVAVTSSIATAMARLEHSATDILVVGFDLIDSDSGQHVRQILNNWSSLKIVSYRTSLLGTLKKIQTVSLDSERIQVVQTSPEPEEIASAIVRHLQQLNRTAGRPTLPQVGPKPSTAASFISKLQKRPRLIVLGVSTGGPNALAELLPSIPASIGVPILIVQHMPMAFIPPMAERLNSISRLDVKVASHGETLSGPVCRIAPGECHMEVRLADSSLTTHLSNGPPENSCKPAADVLFRSAARACGPHVLGVVLTGMGRDGCAGALEIVQQGGSIIIQDEATSVVWGMPGAVVEAGIAHEMLPLQQIGSAIARRFQS